MATFLTFLGVSLIIIVMPGPDTAVTVRNALLGGRLGGLFTALGVAAGQTVWVVATSAGMVALLIASEPLFLAVKYAGAGYLAFLGIQAIREALRRTSSGPPSPQAERPRRLEPQAAFRQGLISNLANPKMAVFFASLLPQFAPAGGATFWSLLLLGIVFVALTLAWLSAYSVVIGKAGDLLRRPAVRRTIEGVTGTLLVGLGLRLAVEPAP